MLRILLILAGVFTTAGFIIWKIFLGSSPTPSLSLPGNFSVTDKGITQTTQTTATSSATLENRVKELEFEVTDLFGKVKGTTTAGSSSTDVKAMQATIDDLKKRVDKLEGTTTTTSTQTTTTTQKSPIYIPVGASFTVSNSSYTDADNSSISINPSDYSGYTSMQLEGNLSVASGNDKAYARIENSDGTSILASEVTTTSQSTVWVSSAGFSIGSGNKVYKIQMKTLTGFGATLSNSRIKVNF